jgi:hypothetical protein
MAIGQEVEEELEILLGSSSYTQENAGKRLQASLSLCEFLRTRCLRANLGE